MVVIATSLDHCTSTYTDQIGTTGAASFFSSSIVLSVPLPVLVASSTAENERKTKSFTSVYVDVSEHN